jgi:hypothetical protein
MPKPMLKTPKRKIPLCKFLGSTAAKETKKKEINYSLRKLKAIEETGVKH